MKIRTITIGINISQARKELADVSKYVLELREKFETSGLEIQSIRITTQPWPEYLGKLEEFEEETANAGIDFISIGSVKEPSYLKSLPDLITATERVSASVTIDDEEIIPETAEVFLNIGKVTGGIGNFRFGAISNSQPDIPFFPASYHDGDRCFSIGLECSDLVNKAFETADLDTARDQLYDILSENFKKIESLAKGIDHITFKGIDTDESIVFAFEKIMNGRFGSPGTLTIARMITRVLTEIKVRYTA